MQSNLGEKIKELRKRDGRKQEELANALGVTAQAISRWEANGGYPDIQMIPAIANYFHITIDELFGYHNDRDKKIAEYRDEAIRLIHEEESSDKVISLLRSALLEFPAEETLQTVLASALYKKGYEEYAKQCEKPEGYEKMYTNEPKGKYTNSYWEEAVSLYEKLSETNGNVVVSLISLYSLMREYEKAENVAKRQQKLSNSRELMLAHIHNPEKEEKNRGIALISLLHELRNAVEDAVLRTKELKSTEEGLGILSAMERLCNALVPDGDFGIFSGEMCMHKLSCAGICNQMKDYETAAEYWEEAVLYFQRFETTKKARKVPCGPLFQKTETEDIESIPVIIPEREFLLYTFEQFPENIKGWLRENPKYEVLF